MKRAWLDAFTWEMVIAANAALCQGKGALHRPSSDGHERARQLWERQHPQAMWLDEAVKGSSRGQLIISIYLLESMGDEFSGSTAAREVVKDSVHHTFAIQRA